VKKKKIVEWEKKGKKDNKNKGKILARLSRGRKKKARRRKKENWGVGTKKEGKKHRAKMEEK
jgi:hypothetical protein